MNSKSGIFTRGDSNENTQYTVFNIAKKITLIIQNLQPRDFSQGLQHEFETAMVNEPSVFEQLKFYCTFFYIYLSVDPDQNAYLSNHF